MKAWKKTEALRQSILKKAFEERLAQITTTE